MWKPSAKLLALTFVPIIAIALIFGAYLGISLGGNFTTSSETSTSSATTCQNPPGYYGPCPFVLVYDFQISVSYNGSWNVSYQGYLGGSDVGTKNISGSYSGTGNNTASIRMSGGIQELTLCAWAKKLDNSTSNLALTVGATSNSTTARFGSVEACETVAP